MQPLFISRLPAFSHNEMSSFRMCFNDLEAETKYRTWQFKLKLHIMWKIGAVILMSCLGFLAEVASLQFERHFNHIVSLGLGLLVCVGVGFVMLACWRSAPMMLHQLLLFAIVCDCAALALLSDARESWISELNVITMVALLFSPAFPWRWATLLSAVTIFSQWRNPHLNILQALIGWALCVVMAHDIELQDRRFFQVQQAFEHASKPDASYDSFGRTNCASQGMGRILDDNIPRSATSDVKHSMLMHTLNISDFSSDIGAHHPHRPWSRVHSEIPSSPSGTVDDLQQDVLHSRIGTLLLCKLSVSSSNLESLREQAKAFIKVCGFLCVLWRSKQAVTNVTCLKSWGPCPKIGSTNVAISHLRLSQGLAMRVECAMV